MKLKFSSEKEALDLRTGKMVDVATGKAIEPDATSTDTGVTDARPSDVKPAD
jgi:hypothetical protein